MEDGRKRYAGRYHDNKEAVIVPSHKEIDGKQIIITVDSVKGVPLENYIAGFWIHKLEKEESQEKEIDTGATGGITRDPKDIESIGKQSKKAGETQDKQKHKKEIDAITIGGRTSSRASESTRTTKTKTAKEKENEKKRKRGRKFIIVGAIAIPAFIGLQTITYTSYTKDTVTNKHQIEIVQDGDITEELSGPVDKYNQESTKNGIIEGEDYTGVEEAEREEKALEGKDEFDEAKQKSEEAIGELDSNLSQAEIDEKIKEAREAEETIVRQYGEKAEFVEGTVKEAKEELDKYPDARTEDEKEVLDAELDEYNESQTVRQHNVEALTKMQEDAERGDIKNIETTKLEKSTLISYDEVHTNIEKQEYRGIRAIVAKFTDWLNKLRGKKQTKTIEEKTTRNTNETTKDDGNER